MKKIKRVFGIVTAATLSMVQLMTPYSVFAASTVTTNNAVIGSNGISFSGAINSDGTIENRGFDYELLNQSSTISSPNYTKTRSISGGPNPADGSFNSPGGVAEDSSGNIYTVDLNNKVQKFNSQGIFISSFGTYGSEDGQFSTPTGIALDSQDNIYVVDNNNRIQKFTNSGAFITKTGEYGTEDGQFNYPTNIALDHNDNVFVVDKYNDRIQKFDANLQHMLTFGTPGNGGGSDPVGTFSGPGGITVDSENNVYVVNTNNHRVDKLTNNGTPIVAIGGWGPCNSCFRYPTSISVDSSDNLYAIDYRGGYNWSYIKRFNKNGVFDTQVGSYGSGDGQFKMANDLVASKDGTHLFVADTENNRIQKILHNGTFVLKWGQYDTAGAFSYPSGAVHDQAGNLYIVDSYNNRIQKFDANGSFVKRWGNYGVSDGQFAYPSAITVDPQGNIVVSDTGNNRIQKFDANGTFISKWGVYGDQDGQFSSPAGISYDSTGKLLVVDSYNNRIQKFDANGTFISKWGVYGEADNEFSYPSYITADDQGNVYVADTYNYRIQKFDASGGFISTWGSNGIGNGQFSNISGLKFYDGKLYISESNSNRIQVFSEDGEFLSKITPDQYPGMSSPNLLDVTAGEKITMTEGSSVIDIEKNVFSNGSFTEVSEFHSSNEFRLYCEKQLKYRAYAVIDGQRVNGEYKTATFPDCSGPDLKLDIQLSEPGVATGQQATYTFKTKNVGNEATSFSDPDDAYVLYVAAPDELTLSSLTGDGYECEDSTSSIASDAPALAHHLGKLYACVISKSQIDVGEFHSKSLVFNVVGNPPSDMKMRGMVFGGESEIGAIDIYIALEGADDIFAMPFNNVATYTGLNSGSTEDQDAEQANTATLSNSVNGNKVLVETPMGTNITCSNVLKESANTQQDDSYEYPLGLVEFCFDTANQNNQVSLTFVTDLKPNQVKARKYNSDSKQYFDVQGALITATQVDGKSALKLTYNITDNGPLDINHIIGSIKDPVGLAVSGDLAETGTDTRSLLLIAVTNVIGFGFILYRSKLRSRL